MPNLVEHERSRKRNQLPYWPELAKAHPNQILTFFEFCQLNRISPRTLRRLIAKGEGPEVVRLTGKRGGITIAACIKWQATRLRKTKSK